MSQQKPLCRAFLVIALTLCLATGVSAYATVRIEPPKWVSELEYKPDVIETVGYSTEMLSSDMAFKRADHKARVEMASVLSAVVKSSIEDSVFTDKTLDSGTVNIIYKELTKLYASEVISGVSIVERYVDPETGMVYSLARLRRADAIKDASVKARFAIRRSRSLFDELLIDSEICSRLKPRKAEFIEATGFATVSNSKPGTLEGAMMDAELNARAALAQLVRVSMTNDVRSWVEAHEGGVDGDSSVDRFLESISRAFTEVKLEGSRIMKRYFSPETNMVYAQAVMERKFLAREFISAAAPEIEKSNKAELEEDLNRVIHNSLDVLIRGSDKR